jgi:hypothetical protein
LGQTLVTDGFDRLTDGAQVVVRAPAEAPAEANPNSAQGPAPPEPNPQAGPANGPQSPVPGNANPGHSKHSDTNSHRSGSTRKTPGGQTTEGPKKNGAETQGTPQ